MHTFTMHEARQRCAIHGVAIRYIHGTEDTYVLYIHEDRNHCKEIEGREDAVLSAYRFRKEYDARFH